MAPERWHRVEQLYHEALACEPERREEYLRKACGSDEELRREIQQLLGYWERAKDFIEVPAIEIAARFMAEGSEPAIGQMIGRYQILSLLGSGGMGVVYLAHDPRLGRSVALKFLRNEFTGDEVALERFRAEARTLSLLNHPNICAIYDIGEAAGRTFIVMEYVSGRRLDEIIRRGNMHPGEVLNYAVQIAAGLAKAHAAGIIHRDLKPGNVMVGDDGQIKLLDFGIAKLARATGAGLGSGETTLTAAGAIVGTTAYMSPEQAEAKNVDGRSDVFAFGALLYEMITGRRAFPGETNIATLSAILYADPEPVSRMSPAIPSELQRIVSRCLRKDPERRFQTVADLRVALQEIREETAAGLPARVPVPFRARSRRPRRRAIAVAALALLLIAAVWFALGQRGKSSWPIPADKRIAVLLFTNIGGDPANQALCDGLVEEVSNSLSRLEQFHGALVVIPASDVRKDGIASAREAGKSLGANLAITGSVERTARGSVRVLINLVDTGSVTQLRTGSIDTVAPDLPDLQDKVMENIARMLELELKPQTERAVKAGGTRIAAAYAAYVKGLGYLGRYDRPENIESAIRSFRHAVDLDPGYVLAFSGMAEAYWRRYEALKDGSSIDMALVNASRALDLNDGLAPVHITMGIVRAGKGQYELAEGEFKTAQKLDPLNGHAWLELAKVYDATGQREKAESSYRKAVELRKDDWATLNQIGVSYFNKAQYAEAEPYFLQVVQLTPDSANAYSNLGGLYLTMGRWADAASQLRRSISIEPTANALSNLGSSLYYAGRYADAAASFEKATLITPSDSLVWGNLADAYRYAPGRAGKARETYRHALDLIQGELATNFRDGRAHALAATWWAALGDEKQSSSEIARAILLSPSDATVQFRAALVYEEAGDRPRALQALKSALDGGYALLQIDNAPPFDKLRADPHFRRLVEDGGTMKRKPGIDHTK